MKIDQNNQKWGIISNAYYRSPYDGGSGTGILESFEDFLKKNNAIMEERDLRLIIVFNSDADATIFFLKYNH